MTKACPKFRALVPGMHRTFTATARGVDYFVQRDVLTGRWYIQATIKGRAKPLPGGPWNTKAAAHRAVCEHAEFYATHFAKRRR